MKYKVGDRVRIKSLDWYNENKDEDGYIDCGVYSFFPFMSKFCGKTFEIAEVHSNCYNVKDVCARTLEWTDEMIEGLVEEETKPNIIEEAKTYWDSIKDAWICPEGYQFKDENGNVINATKIVLEKKKKEYPKSYEECEKILGLEDSIIEGCLGYEYKLLNAFQKLLMCRDAYWKIAGQEKSLNKPWHSDHCTIVYGICRSEGCIIKLDDCWGDTLVLEFPTPEMRDEFYENFKELINECKELL